MSVALTYTCAGALITSLIQGATFRNGDLKEQFFVLDWNTTLNRGYFNTFFAW